MTPSRLKPRFRSIGPARLRRRPLGRYRYVRLRWRVLFAGIDCLGTVAFAVARAVRAFVGRLAAGPPESPADVCNNDPRTILVVQLDHLGDAVLSTAMLAPLRKRYPFASIEVLASPANREVFEAMPQVDRVHVSRRNRFAQRCRFAWIPASFWWGWTLRRRKVDLAIDVRGDFPAALILWLSGARRRLGWTAGGGGFLLTDSPPFVPGRPELQSRLALLAELGIRPLAGQTWQPVFRTSTAAHHRIARMVEQLSRQSPTLGPRFVLHVAAGTAAKRWPVEHWQELIGRIVVSYGAQVVLVGTAGDRAIARQILGTAPLPGVVDWTGLTNVAELAALLEQADLLVGTDSGPAHLANAVGTPVVVLFSGTNHPPQWQPRGQHVCVLRRPVACSPCHRHRCPLAGHPCMSGLTPREVAEAIEVLYRQTVRRAGEPWQPTRQVGAAPAERITFQNDFSAGGGRTEPPPSGGG